jgi:predicted nucleic acid-binding protein
MLVVSDTSPVTALLQVGQEGLLPALFGQVLIPPVVRNELLRYHSVLPDYLEVRAIQNQQALATLSTILDLGEAEAIVLAEESQAHYLLMDEKRGRSAAQSRGLTVIGLLGVLLLAKKTGHLNSVRQLMDDLQSKAGFFVSDLLKYVTLKAAGEEPSGE